MIENKNLKREIVDLKTNLMINKEIIQGFFQLGNKEEKINFYLSKLKEENQNEKKIYEKIEKENEELRKKV